MQKILSIRQVVYALESEGTRREFTASAEASFEPSSSSLRIELGCQAELVSGLSGRSPLKENWLPHPKKVLQLVTKKEALEKSEEIFNAWQREIRRSILQKVSTPAKRLAA